MDSKKPWQSKTMWAAVLTTLAGFVPGVKEWIAVNPEIFSTVIGCIFGGVRLITKGKIDIKDSV